MIWILKGDWIALPRLVSNIRADNNKNKILMYQKIFTVQASDHQLEESDGHQGVL